MFGDLAADCMTGLLLTLVEDYANHVKYYRHPSEDRLFNPQAVIPSRPTITNIQWISGTQYVSPADMDILSPFPFLAPA